MGKLFFAISVAALAVAAGSARARAQPEPLAVVVPIKLEQVTAAAHLTWRDPDHNAVFESNLVTVGEVPMVADSGCRMRDSAQDAAPSAPKDPAATPRTPPHDSQASIRPKGRWIACS